MNRVQRLLTVGTAVIGMLALTGTSANAQSDGTPDGFRVEHPNGYIEWNDYANDDHSIDYDNIWVVGVAGDGKTLRVTAWYGDESISKSVGDGGRETISFSTNVTDGTSVKWQACVLNNGSVVSCWITKSFTE